MPVSVTATWVVGYLQKARLGLLGRAALCAEPCPTDTSPQAGGRGAAGTDKGVPFVVGTVVGPGYGR